MHPRFLLAPLLLLSPPDHLVEFRCDATTKFDFEGQWDSARLSSGQWHVLVEDLGTKAWISRCSYAPSKRRVTCDRYSVDQIESDPFIKAKKYYVFNSQYDLQIFEDMKFVENNGRSAVTYGTCQTTAP